VPPAYPLAMTEGSERVPGRDADPDGFRASAEAVLAWVTEYMRRVEEFPVLSRAAPGDLLAALPEHPPERGLAEDAWDPILADLDRLVLPGVTHWQSPRFFGYFPCNASPPAILGELVSAGLNVQGMLWQTSPAATELEVRMLDWMAEAFGLPGAFRSTAAGGGGVIQGTASEAALVALCAARGRALGDVEADAPMPHLTLYASDQAHSSVLKAAMIAGLARAPGDRTHLRLIETDDRHRLRPDALAGALRADIEAGRVPAYLCATIGTTSTGAVDPMEEIGRVLRETCGEGRLPWLHVDAAWAGAALVCPEHRWMARGLEEADSVCINPHKWLLTNFDCDLLWTRDREAIARSLSVTPEYLRNEASESGEVIDYRDWQIPLGRRFRSLKLWFVLRYYGLEGLRAHIRRHVELAAVFESLVKADPRFELMAPRALALVCFRYTGAGDEAAGAELDGRNRELLGRINATGRAFLTHTAVPTPDGPRVALRMAIGAPSTREAHVREAWEVITGAAAELGS